MTVPEIGLFSCDIFQICKFKKLMVPIIMLTIMKFLLCSSIAGNAIVLSSLSLQSKQYSITGPYSEGKGQ
jgi:hypothetical protein